MEWIYTEHDGKCDGTEVFPFMVLCPLRNTDEVKKRFDAVSDPDSKHYGEFMDKAAMDALTAPPPEQVERVRTWLAAQEGIIDAKAEMAGVKVAAPAAAVEALLKTDLHRYRVPEAKKKELGGLQDYPPYMVKRQSDYVVPEAIKADVDVIDICSQDLVKE